MVHWNHNLSLYTGELCHNLIITIALFEVGTLLLYSDIWFLLVFNARGNGDQFFVVNFHYLKHRFKGYQGNIAIISWLLMKFLIRRIEIILKVNFYTSKSSPLEVFCKKGVKCFNFIKKVTLTQVFSCEFCEIFDLRCLLVYYLHIM